jgi:hypothetical protein
MPETFAEPFSPCTAICCFRGPRTRIINNLVLIPFSSRRRGSVTTRACSEAGKARSFGVGEIKQPVQSIGEPRRHTLWRRALIDAGRGDQLSRRLAFGKRAAQLL